MRKMERKADEFLVTYYGIQKREMKTIMQKRRKKLENVVRFVLETIMTKCYDGLGCHIGVMNEQCCRSGKGGTRKFVNSDMDPI